MQETRDPRKDEKDPGECSPERLPEQIALAIKELLGKNESIVAACESDMLCSGSFGDSYLVASNSRLIVLETGQESGKKILEIPIAEISMFERRELRGCCRLEAKTITGSTVVAYFTRSHQRQFEQFIECIRPYISGETDQNSPQENANGEATRRPSRFGGNDPFGSGAPKICEKCGKPIPRRVGVCPDCIDHRELILRLLSLAKPYLFPMLGSLILMLVITGVEMVQPLLTKILIDNVIPDSNISLFIWIIIAIAAIHSFSAIFSGIRTYVMGWLGEHITHNLRRDVYNHVQALSLDFYDQHQTGWIMDRVSADTSNLQNFLSEGFQDFIRDIMTLLVIFAIMFAMDWSLTLMTLIPAPIVIILTRRFMSRMHRVWHSTWRKRAWMTSHLSNVIPGVRVVKAFAQEKREGERFADSSRNYMDAHIKIARKSAQFHPTINFAISLGFVAVWAYGGYQVITGKGVTLGTLIAFISYLWRFYGPLGSLTRFGARAQRALTSAQRVFDILDTDPTVVEPSTRREMPPIDGCVEFRDVSFSYNPDEPVLRDISFTVESGEMIGLVGPSGAGKSTTINLLCRFYDVNNGYIKIDGIDVRDVTLASLHRQIGVVLQEPFLFHGTIGENIAYGKPDSNHDEIIRAAKTANAHEFITRLPDAYDTLAGERGQRLSGGERQRIAIARAILKNPRILILDEATSSVDTETEAAIQEAIARLVRGRTTFAIAHRFSTLRNANRLIVIDQGKIAEIGTHEELLAKEDGLFRRLVDIQNKNNQVVAIGG